MIKNSFYY